MLRGRSRPFAVAGLVTALTLATVACAPAAQPSPTAAPANAAPTAPPAKSASQPAATSAPAKPAQSKAAAPAASPDGTAAFDEKAIADFYQGKTVRIIVGFTPGGGFDSYSRLI